MKTLLKNVIRPFYHFLNNKNEREFYRLYDKWGKKERYTKISDIKFLKNTFDIPDALSFIWQFKEIFVDEIYKFKSANDIPVILDCGSNVGMSLFYFGKNYPNAKIVGFEADERIAKMSISNMERNDIKNVKVLNCAVWINNNGIKFSVEGADAGSINGIRNVKTVKSIRLKDYLQNEPYIDLLKIDIEGAEYEVLTDCKESLSNVNNIFVEYHSWNNSPQKFSEILAILEQNGFRYYIEDVSKRKQPLINNDNDKEMDLQLNVFGFKIYDKK